MHTRTHSSCQCCCLLPCSLLLLAFSSPLLSCGAIWVEPPSWMNMMKCFLPFPAHRPRRRRPRVSLASKQVGSIAAHTVRVPSPPRRRLHWEEGVRVGEGDGCGLPLFLGGGWVEQQAGEEASRTAKQGRQGSRQMLVGGWMRGRMRMGDASMGMEGVGLALWHTQKGGGGGGGRHRASIT